MKKFLISQFLFLVGFFGANATVLFPFFVDIAPEYKDGNSPQFLEVGVDNVKCFGTKPDFLLKSFSSVEAFYKDVLPGDVIKEESIVKGRKLITYTSINENNDVIKTDALKCTIYVLELPDGKYAAGYSEERIPLK